MSNLRGACGVTRWEGESNESEYQRCGIVTHANGVKCGVVKWMKRNTLWWVGHLEKKKSEKFVKKLEGKKKNMCVKLSFLGRE